VAVAITVTQSLVVGARPSLSFCVCVCGLFRCSNGETTPEAACAPTPRPLRFDFFSPVWLSFFLVFPPFADYYLNDGASLHFLLLFWFYWAARAFQAI
jgi:hypothetical protein